MSVKLLLDENLTPAAAVALVCALGLEVEVFGERTRTQAPRPRVVREGVRAHDDHVHALRNHRLGSRVPTNGTARCVLYASPEPIEGREQVPLYPRMMDPQRDLIR